MNINRLIRSFEKFRKQYLTLQFRLRGDNLQKG